MLHTISQYAFEADAADALLFEYSRRKELLDQRSMVAYDVRDAAKRFRNLVSLPEPCLEADPGLKALFLAHTELRCATQAAWDVAESAPELLEATSQEVAAQEALELWRFIQGRVGLARCDLVFDTKAGGTFSLQEVWVSEVDKVTGALSIHVGGPMLKKDGALGKRGLGTVLTLTPAPAKTPLLPSGHEVHASMQQGVLQ